MSIDDVIYTNRKLIAWTDVDLSVGDSIPGQSYRFKPHNEEPAFDTVSWTVEREAKLREFYAEGFSAGKIAKRFGDCTRNAIIGKLHRLGLRRGQTSASTISTLRCSAMGLKPTRRTEKARKVSRINSVFNPDKTFERPAAIMPEFKRVPRLEGIESEPSGWSNSIGIPLLDLEAHQCRWPLGKHLEPASLFCGLECAGTYCDRHHRLAYQAPQVRRRLKDIP